MKKIVALITLIVCCFSLFACQDNNGDKDNLGNGDVVSYDGTEGLDFYPFPDGSYGVTAGKAKYLENIVIPSEYNGYKVKYILQCAFYMSTNLKILVIPEGVTTLEAFAFGNCTSLESVIIPSSVTKIYTGAFAGCTSLSKIQFAGTMQQWSSVEFITKHVYISPDFSTGKKWSYQVPAIEVICSDGTVPIN